MHFKSIISLGVLTIAGSIINASPIPKDESGLSTGDKVVVGLSVGGGLLALGGVTLLAHGRLKTPKATADILNPSSFHPSAPDLPFASHSGHNSQRLSVTELESIHSSSRPGGDRSSVGDLLDNRTPPRHRAQGPPDADRNAGVGAGPALAPPPRLEVPPADSVIRLARPPESPRVWGPATSHPEPYIVEHPAEAVPPPERGGIYSDYTEHASP